MSPKNHLCAVEQTTPGNHNKTKCITAMCIFQGTYCTCDLWNETKFTRYCFKCAGCRRHFITPHKEEACPIACFVNVEMNLWKAAIRHKSPAIICFHSLVNMHYEMVRSIQNDCTLTKFYVIRLMMQHISLLKHSVITMKTKFNFCKRKRFMLWHLNQLLHYTVYAY